MRERFGRKKVGLHNSFLPPPPPLPLVLVGLSFPFSLLQEPSHNEEPSIREPHPYRVAHNDDIEAAAKHLPFRNILSFFFLYFSSSLRRIFPLASSSFNTSHSPHRDHEEKTTKFSLETFLFFHFRITGSETLIKTTLRREKFSQLPHETNILT